MVIATPQDILSNSSEFEKIARDFVRDFDREMATRRPLFIRCDAPKPGMLTKRLVATDHPDQYRQHGLTVVKDARELARQILREPPQFWLAFFSLPLPVTHEHQPDVYLASTLKLGNGGIPIRGIATIQGGKITATTFDIAYALAPPYYGITARGPS